MARVSFGAQTGTRMRATGRTTKLTVSVTLSLKTARKCTLASGKTTYTTVKVSKVGLMAPDSMVISPKGRRTALEPTSGQMGHSTLETG
jgi:hypothetical protein